MAIQRPVLEEPSMEGTYNADPVSLNNSSCPKRRTVICGTCACFLFNPCGWKRRTVICGTCGGNHYRKTPCWNRDLWLSLICSLLMLVSKLFILQIKVVIYVWSKSHCAFSNCHVFNFFRLFKIVGNFCRVFSKTLFSSTVIFVVYLAIFVLYLAKPFKKSMNFIEVIFR